MSVATPRPGTWGTACAWLVLALWFCVAISSCSLRNTAADASSFADVGGETGFDVAVDGSDSAEISADDLQDGPTTEIADAIGDGVDGTMDAGDAITDAESDDGQGLAEAGAGDATDAELADSGEVMDAITDAVTDAVLADDGVGVDLVAVDIPIAEATPAVDTAVPCSATEVPAALTGTVEFDFSPLVPNPVVMGCGKGAPKPVKEGTPGCCKCAPPYSCYCNGECGWLRAPDLVKPQHDGQAVWTGKWVVSVGESYGLNDPGPSTMHVQKWQPGSGKGFQVVPLPPAWFKDGYPKVFIWGKVLVIAAAHALNSVWETQYSPVQPIFLYDPDTDAFSEIAMPVCGKLLLSGATLVCVAEGKSTAPSKTAGLQVYDMLSNKWNLVQPPEKLLPPTWWIAEPNDSTADAAAVYLVGGVLSSKAWPDGTTDFPGPTRHILKYEVLAGKWSDIGAVPVEWHTAPFAMDHIGIVAIKGSIQAARFRLDTFKWEVGPKITYGIYGHQELSLTPCGLLFGSGDLGDALGGGMAYRPVLLGPDLSWTVLPPWGYPNDAKTSRHSANFVLTDKEVIALGGMDGPPEGAFIYHKDSYRYPLSALCTNGGPK